MSASLRQFAWFKKVSGVVAGTARRVLRTTTPDTFLNHRQFAVPGQRMTLVHTLLIICVAVPAFARPDEPPRSRATASRQPSDSVTVTVHPVAITKGREITIGDVATIEGEPALKNQIAALDVADSPNVGKSARLSRELIAYRIQLAGIDARRFQIQGAPSVTVTYRGYTVPESEIVAAARQFLLSRLPWSADDLSIEPTQPIHVPVHVPGERTDVRLEVNSESTRVALGTVRVDVAVLSRGVKQSEVAVSLDVRLHQTIAVVSRRIERGQPLTADNVYFERRRVDAAGRYLTESESPIGQRAKRVLLPLQPIATSDVEPAEPNTPVVVKQRDVVQLVARTGGMVITTSGEALQDGRAGQVIRVRNIDSKTVVTGRVVGRNEVRVLY